MNCRSKTTPEVYSRDNCSSPRATLLFSALPQESSHPRSIQNSLSSPTNLMFSEVTTPEQETVSKVDNQEPEAESCWSANSNFWKRRKITSLSSVSHLHEFSNPDRFSSLASSITTTEATHNKEETCHSEKDRRKFKPSLSTPNSSAVSHISSDANMAEGLRIFCTHCKNPFGLLENDLLVKCSLMSTSKAHLMSLLKKTSEPVDVLVSDMPSVHPRVLTSQESASGQGIWCKEDGCVFNSIFCPFCDQSDNCIGVHVVATDESNTQFQNKVRVFMLLKKISFFLWQRFKFRLIFIFV